MIENKIKKLAILKNNKENSLLITMVETTGDNENQESKNHDVKIILDNIKEVNSYKIIGELFNSIGQLDKSKTIKLYFNLIKTPLAFILLAIKINVLAKSKIEIFMKDTETIKTFNNFLNDNIDSFLGEIPDVKLEALDECSTTLKEKMTTLIKENDNKTFDEEISQLKKILENSKEELNPEQQEKINNLNQNIEFMQSIYENDEFNSIFEGTNKKTSLQNEIRKLNMQLF